MDIMKHVRKDLLISKDYAFRNILILAFVAAAFTFSFGPFFVYLCLPFFTTRYLISHVLQVENEHNGNLIMLSMPTSRKSIVTAKYVDLFIVYFISLGLAWAASLLTNLLLGIFQANYGGAVYMPPVHVLLTSLFIIIVTDGIRFPLIYSYGKEKSGVYNTGTLLGGWVLVLIATFYIGEGQPVRGVPPYVLSLILIAAIIAVATVSYSLSLRFIHRRDI